MHEIPVPRCAIILCGDEAPTLDPRLEEASDLAWLKAEPAAAADSSASGVRISRLYGAEKRSPLTPQELPQLLAAMDWVIIVEAPSPAAEHLASGVAELLHGTTPVSLFSAQTHPSIEAKIRARIPTLYHHQTDETITPLTAALALVGSVSLPAKGERLELTDYQSIMGPQGTVTTLLLPSGVTTGDVLPLRELPRILSGSVGSIAYVSLPLTFADFATVCDACRKRETPYAVIQADQQGLPPALYLFTRPDFCH